MKTLLILLASLLPLLAAAQSPQQIYCTGTPGSGHPCQFRGPFTDSPAAQSGETVITLTDAQYADLISARAANAGAVLFAFDGSTFTVAPIEQLRLGLLALYKGLNFADQDAFEARFLAAKKRLSVGDVTGVQGIINLTVSGESAEIGTCRTAMLALITSLYGASPPSVNLPALSQ